MIHSLRGWIGRGLFWLMISWVFPIELMTCHGLGERYASRRRAASSLFLLLALALATALRQSWPEAFPVLVFAGLTGVAYALQRIQARSGKRREIGQNPWSLGIPPWPFRDTPRLFWFAAQPLLALTLGLACLPISRTLSLYFALAAPLLWIFRRLSLSLVPRQTQPTRAVAADAAQPASGERVRAPTPDPLWPGQGPKLPQTSSGPGPTAPPFEEGGGSQAAHRFRFRIIETLILFAAAGTGLISSMVGLRHAVGFLDEPSDEVFLSCVRVEQERLASLIPNGWRLQPLKEEKETALTEDTLRRLSQQGDTALLSAMQRDWTGETVYLVLGDFVPRAAIAVRFPTPGIVVEWTPWSPHRTSGPSRLLCLYVQTKPEAAKELQRVLEQTRKMCPFRFEKESRLVPFDVTRAGQRIILHCLSSRSFAFRIGDFELSQELPDQGNPPKHNPP
ncbi:MAG: hypothetical protein PHO89_01525 [Methylacidiphilaceae bacterium]|nr:hypothetical protein [Candidatus Methylacidiphilaceae bacterium]